MLKLTNQITTHSWSNDDAIQIRRKASRIIETQRIRPRVEIHARRTVALGGLVKGTAAFKSSS